jgi:hypothetical protein
MPKEGSAAHSALRVIWKGIGIIACLMAAFMAYLLFFNRS